MTIKHRGENGQQPLGWGGPDTLSDELLWTLLLLPPPKIEKKEQVSHKNLSSEMVATEDRGCGAGRKGEGIKKSGLVVTEQP